MPVMEWSGVGDIWHKQCGMCLKVFKATAINWDAANTLFEEVFERQPAGTCVDKLRTYCKSCRFNKRYKGIDRLEKLKEQEGRCGICNKEITFNTQQACMDHDHKTNKIRGILCAKCNTWMAAVDDDEWLTRALIYRDLHRGLDPFHSFRTEVNNDK